MWRLLEVLECLSLLPFEDSYLELQQICGKPQTGPSCQNLRHMVGVHMCADLREQKLLGKTQSETTLGIKLDALF